MNPETLGMETIEVEDYGEIPNGFTGIAEYADGSKQWLLNRKLHRVDGPAWENADGTKAWWLNGNDVFTLEPIGEYIVIEDGLPSTMEWLGNPVSTLKVLTAEGIKYIPNLPGV